MSLSTDSDGWLRQVPHCLAFNPKVHNVIRKHGRAQ